MSPNRGKTVAIIGLDGSGKSTIARRVAEAHAPQVKLVYMGLNASRANTPVTLSKVAESLVRHDDPGFRGDRPDRRGRAWASLRLAYRILEETLRFVQVAWFRRRGMLVVMDRHFRYDHLLGGDRPRRLSDRLHQRFLEHLTPEPNLVVVLDVPVPVAQRRSGEGSAPYHERRRAAYLGYAASCEHVHPVDADRPLEAVVADVLELVGRTWVDQSDD